MCENDGLMVQWFLSLQDIRYMHALFTTLRTVSLLVPLSLCSSFTLASTIDEYEIVRSETSPLLKRKCETFLRLNTNIEMSVIKLNGG